jgi:tetratricopeptide (TPR) repeat protein
VQDDSRRVNEEVARLARAAGDRRSLGVALACLGGHFYWRRRWDKSRAAYEEALPLLREVDDHLMVPHALWGLGRAAVRQGRIEEARRLMDESLRCRSAPTRPSACPTPSRASLRSPPPTIPSA